MEGIRFYVSVVRLSVWGQSNRHIFVVVPHNMSVLLETFNELRSVDSGFEGPLTTEKELYRDGE